MVFECLSHHAKQQYVEKEIASATGSCSAPLVPPSEGLVQTQWESLVQSQIGAGESSSFF